MSNNVQMFYGSYEFKPVPQLNITQSPRLAGDGQPIGNSYNIQLNGTLTPLPDGTGGLAQVIDEQNSLKSGIVQDGLNFRILCDSVELFSTYPKVGELSLDEGNWVFLTDYSLSFTYDDVNSLGIASGHYVENIQENWGIQFTDRSKYSFVLPNGGGGDSNGLVLNLTHNVSAQGLYDYTESLGSLTQQPWKNAKDFVISRLGYDSTKTGSGVLNIDINNFTVFNHSRVQNTDELGGSFGVSESWVLLESGISNSGFATEDFQASVNTNNQNGLTSVNMNGTIQGLEQVTFGTNPGDYMLVSNKYDNASGYWNNVKDKLYQRAVLLSNPTRTMNILPLTTVISHTPSKGVIGYRYSYNDRPSNCIPNSLTESILISDTNQADIFASIFVIGRTNGPVLQEMGTKTVAKRSAAIDVIMPPTTGCVDTESRFDIMMANSPKSDVNTIITAVQNSLETASSQVFKDSDSESWDYKTGKYDRNVSWTYGQC